MANVKNKLVEMLKKQAEVDKAKALLSLELLSNHAVGIGDHSFFEMHRLC